MKKKYSVAICQEDDVYAKKTGGKASLDPAHCDDGPHGLVAECVRSAAPVEETVFSCEAVGAGMTARIMGHGAEPRPYFVMRSSRCSMQGSSGDVTTGSAVHPHRKKTVETAGRRSDTADAVRLREPHPPGRSPAPTGYREAFYRSEPRRAATRNSAFRNPPSAFKKQPREAVFQSVSAASPRSVTIR